MSGKFLKLHFHLFLFLYMFTIQSTFLHWVLVVNTLFVIKVIKPNIQFQSSFLCNPIIISFQRYNAEQKRQRR
jgi:hypothetical protein